MDKVYADFVALQQDNFDAFVKSGTTVAKGFEQLTKHFADLTAKSFEESIDLGKKFATLKTVNDVVAFQSKVFEERFESMITNGKKVAEMSAEIVKNASAPIADRVKANVAAANTVAATIQKSATQSKKAA
ncbi:MAG: phasin family protein [Alphaproteobacteria bacterium]|nr:phasin family protein [Alphaproteobacteria bacterium]